MERVQKVIANLGYASRREAERLIQDGKVLINGNVANLGDKVTTSDIIKIEGVILDKTKSNDKAISIKYIKAICTFINPNTKWIINKIIGKTVAIKGFK